MRIYKTLNIGDFHTNNCEDFLIEAQIAPNEKLIAVFDGCSGGKESVFASFLFGKIIRNISRKELQKEAENRDTPDLKSKLKEVLKQLVLELKSIKSQLGLDTNELLSTLMIGIINTEDFSAEFLTVGDGLICNDGDIIEYHQDNSPDYLAYHLEEDFDEWYGSQEQTLSINSFDDLSICTDGIFGFKDFENKSQQRSKYNIFQYLLIDKTNAEFEDFLDRKMVFLKDVWHHTVKDDLAIIRVITTLE